MSAIRRDRNRLNSAGSFSLKRIFPQSFVKLAWRRNTMVNFSFQAKQRLAFLEFNKVVKDVSLTCRIFKISRETFYKWKRRYDPNNLSSLENRPRTPKRKRQREISFEEEMRIKHLREKYIRLGKKKLAILYQKEYPNFPPVSQWKIQKTIEKYHLYFDSEKAKRLRTKRLRNKRKKKIRITQINPSSLVSQEKPFFFCLDTIVLYLPWNIKRYILTAVDYFHKLSYARVYKTSSSFICL
jgi:transposase-like protein